MIGVALVVGRKLSLELGTPMGVGLHLVALSGISAGTLYQKRYCANMNLLSGSAIQLTAATILVGLLALFLETGEIRWTGEFFFTFIWLVIALSFGAIMPFYTLLRRGAGLKPVVSRAALDGAYRLAALWRNPRRHIDRRNGLGSGRGVID